MIHHLPTVVHQVAGGHLGDVWASLSYYHRLSSEQQRVILLASSPTVSEAYGLLDAPGHVFLTDSPATEPPVSYDTIYRLPYFPTKKVWHPSDSKVVCYQFDGRHKAEIKNPTPAQILRFVRRLRVAGLTPLDIGNKFLIEQGIEALAGAGCFVGINSGWTEVVASVGTPMHMVVNGSDTGWLNIQFKYRKRYRFCPTLDDVLFHPDTPFDAINP